MVTPKLKKAKEIKNIKKTKKGVTNEKFNQET